MTTHPHPLQILAALAVGRLAHVALVTMHLLIIGANIAAMIALIATQPWYLWLPINTLLLQRMFGGKCVLTILENQLRVKLGMSQIESFKGHYLHPTNDASRTLQHGSDAPFLLGRERLDVPITARGQSPLRALIIAALLTFATASAQDFSNAKLTPPFAIANNARLTNCTIDGEDSPNNQIQVDGNGVTFDGCKFLRCPGSAIRLHGKASNCRIVNCTFDGSQALNTQDRWQGTGVIFAHNIVRVPAGVEGLLIDQPGVNAKYTGVVIQGNVFECAEGAKRCVGLARCVGVSVTGNTFRGAKGVEDLLHFEDRAAKLLVTGNLFDLAGASHGIDGSNGGDEAYAQKERVPRNCVFTNNSLWCQQGTGFHLQGTAELGPFVRMTITGNTIHDHSVGIDAFLKDSTVSGNTYYGKGVKERLR